VPSQRPHGWLKFVIVISLGGLASAHPEVSLPTATAAALGVALLLGVVLRVIAKTHPQVSHKFLQAFELRFFLLITIIVASRTAANSYISVAISGAALIILSMSLTVGFDGTFLGRTRIVVLMAFAGSYLSLLIITYYQVNSKLSAFFQSYQDQLASMCILLYFIVQPIIVNHDSNLTSLMATLREHAGAIRNLVELKAPHTMYRDRANDSPIMLLIQAEKVRADLTKRREEGREIYDRFNYGSFEEKGIRAEHWYWHTRGLLERWFTDDDVAEEFAAARGAEVRSYRDINYGNVSSIKSALKNQITCIEGILERLDVYELAAPDTNKLAEHAERPREKEPAPSYITYRFSAPVGQLIAGEGQIVKNINSHIAAVVGLGQQDLGEALLKLSEVALADPQLDDSSRAQVLQSIEDLADAAEAPPNERKSGRVRGALEVIGQVSGLATQLGEVWNQWGPIIMQHLH
jgi:hypothetical protein